MFLNRLPKLNWAYAFGEVLLIFIGFTAAFVFDSWKAEQNALRDELAVLTEIDEDLEATQKDLLIDIETSESSLRARSVILLFGRP